MEKIIIREATVTDAEAIAKIHVETWQCAYRGQVPDSYLDSLTVEKRKVRWTEILSRPVQGSKNFVAIYDRKVAGFCTVGPSRDKDAEKSTGELWGIYVDSTQLGNGIGSAMMQSGLQYLVKEGFKNATLWVLTTNNKARQFYEHKGWNVDGQTKVDHRNDFDLHETRYVKNLTEA